MSTQLPRDAKASDTSRATDLWPVLLCWVAVALDIRGTALGVAAGVGRVGAIVGPTLGGALVTAGIAYPWGFYAFTLAAGLAVVTLATVPAHARESD